jgi:2-polyprenyl-3-methyl-5-hydroxy-6-metoxy-1,4-benzoquinol methylase
MIIFPRVSRRRENRQFAFVLLEFVKDLPLGTWKLSCAAIDRFSRGRYDPRAVRLRRHKDGTMNFSLRDVATFEEASSGIQWEETACLLCRSDNWSPLVEAPDTSLRGDGRWFMVVQCRDCGLCFTNPRPTAESMEQFYRVDYRPHQMLADSKLRASSSLHLPLLRAWRSRRKYLPKQGEGRLLDFGCGSGSFLLRMKAQGWKVLGLDASEELVQHLRDDLDLPALAGTLPHPELPDESFDVITMWHALEHVHEPLDALRAAYRLLVPGGKLIVASPNIDCLPFRWFGQAWIGLDLPRHLCHFAPWTLRVLLHRGGFRQVSVRQDRRSGWLRKTARLAERFHPRLSLWRRALQRRAASHLMSWYTYLLRQSDCMIAEAVKK